MLPEDEMRILPILEKEFINLRRNNSPKNRIYMLGILETLKGTQKQNEQLIELITDIQKYLVR